MSVGEGFNFQTQDTGMLRILLDQVQAQESQELGLLVELLPIPKLDKDQEKSPYQYKGRPVQGYIAGEFGDGGE